MCFVLVHSFTPSLRIDSRLLAREPPDQLLAAPRSYSCSSPGRLDERDRRLRIKVTAIDENATTARANLRLLKAIIASLDPIVDGHYKFLAPNLRLSTWLRFIFTESGKRHANLDAERVLKTRTCILSTRLRICVTIL